MNRNDIAAIKALLDDANPRGWKVVPNQDPRQTSRPTIKGRNGYIIHPSLAGFNMAEDADLVVAAINALPELLDLAAKALDNEVGS